jgi:hypothetical protein
VSVVVLKVRSFLAVSSEFAGRPKMAANVAGIDAVIFLRASERYTPGKKCEQIDRDIYAIK